VKKLIGVGVGPGDPELITVKAVRVLREADTVFVPVMADPDGPAAAPGRAEATIRAHIGPEKIRPVPFALNDVGGVTERRASAWRAAAGEVARALEAGAETVAFGTIGDPNVYSTFSYLAQTVRDMVRDVLIETVPGITAMQDLAARSAMVTGTGTALAEGDEPLVLLPLTAGAGALRDALGPARSSDTSSARSPGRRRARCGTCWPRPAAWTVRSSGPGWACPARTSGPPLPLRSCPPCPTCPR
jgi:precorrin-2/cobalt-factor-2 C20-methyltransferase